MPAPTDTLTRAQPLFREVQRFRAWWLWALLGSLTLFLGYGLYQQLVLGTPFGSNPAPDAVLIGTVVFMLLLCGFFAALKLIVEVRPRAVYARFWPFSAKEFPLADIERAEAVTYDPVGEYGGWGMRYSLKGNAYNVRGDRGVRLTFATERKPFLLGSQQAEELAETIRQAQRGQR